MKTRTWSLVIVAAVLFASRGLAESDVEKVEASHKKWLKQKETCGGDYSYKVYWSSAFGFGHETEIVVRDNKVTGRRYRAFTRDNPKAESWTEDGKTLGSHKKGAPAKTLDELYAEAKKVAAAKLNPSQRRYVRVDKQGLLLSCFTIDTRIADDAPKTGVSIASITLGNPDKP